MPHKRKNAKAARSAPEGFSLAFLQQCGMGNKARSEEISFGGRKKILKFLSDLIGATPSPSALEQSMTKCLEEMDACGIIKGMAHANLDMNVNNESIAKLVETHPDRFIGCIDMDIYDMERALRDIDEYILDGPCSCVNLETAWLHNSKPCV